MTEFETQSESDATAVAAFIARRQGVSFVELQNHLDDVMPTRGEIGIFVGDKNICLWGSLSDRLFAAIERCLTQGKIHWVQTTPLVYMADGCMPSLPIFKRVPSKPFKEPRWLPVVFNPGPEKLK
jgi:hypothetical protein